MLLLPASQYSAAGHGRDKSGERREPGRRRLRALSHLARPAPALDPAVARIFFQAIESNFVDKKCPFTGNVSIRGRILTGIIATNKMTR